MKRRSLVWFVCGLSARAAPLEPLSLVFKASQPGEPALDGGPGQGNPFARALLRLLARPPDRLDELQLKLRDYTLAESGGLQEPDLGAPLPISPNPLLAGIRVQALVLAFSDYGSSELNLPGAALDLRRIASAFIDKGWETQALLDPKLTDLLDALARFEVRSRDADVALIYVTGHGLEARGGIWLLPPGFPAQQGEQALVQSALSLNLLTERLQSPKFNFLFYGGCRDNPLAPQ